MRNAMNVTVYNVMIAIDGRSLMICQSCTTSSMMLGFILIPSHQLSNFPAFEVNARRFCAEHDPAEEP